LPSFCFRVPRDRRRTRQEHEDMTWEERAS
jgi:hypothetical protein